MVFISIEKINYRSDQGFTLIEVLLALTIVGIIAVSIYKLNYASVKLINYSQDKLSLKQQLRVISVYLERDIRRASEVAILDIDSDGEDELLLRFGPSGSNERQDYIQYNVKSKKLSKKKPDNNYIDINGDEVEGKTIISDGWPVDWGNNSYITTKRIDIEKINRSDGGDYPFFSSINDLVVFRFKLKNKDHSYVISNKILPEKIK